MRDENFTQRILDIITYQIRYFEYIVFRLQTFIYQYHAPRPGSIFLTKKLMMRTYYNSLLPMPHEHQHLMEKPPQYPFYSQSRI